MVWTLLYIDPLPCGKIYHKSTNRKNLWAPLKEKSDSGMVKFVYLGFVIRFTSQIYILSKYKKISNIFFKKFLNLQRKKLFASINLVFYFAWKPKFQLIILLREFYRSGQFLQSLTLLARNSVETVRVLRISLPGIFMNLTSAKQYLFIYLWYGIS